MSSRQPMDYVDACFFAVDADDMPQVIGALCLLDQQPDVPSIAAQIEQVLDRFPRLRQRVVRQPALAWEDDPSFQPRDHIEVIHSAQIRKRRDLFKEVGNLIRRPPDMERPPWRIVVVTNGVDCHGLVCCVHHGFADGVRVLKFLEALSSSSRDSLPKPVPVDLIETPPAQSLFARLRSAAGCSWKLFTESIRPSRASPLNGRTIGERCIALADFPRADLIRIMRHFGGSMHDTLFTIAAGAIRRFHDDRGQPCRDLRMIVPMSVPPVLEKGGLGNHLVISSLSLPISEPDAAKRLETVRKLFARMKSDGTIAAYAFFGAAIDRLVSRRFHQAIWRPILRSTNLVCTILLGPENIRYMGGARVERIVGFPAPIIRHGAAFSFVSYAGKVCAAVVSDANVVAAPDQLVAHLQNAFQELLKLATGDGESTSDLLGRKHTLPGGELAFDGSLVSAVTDSASDLRLSGHAMLPAGALLEVSLAAGAEVFSRTSFVVHDISFEHPVWLTTEGIYQLQTRLFAEDASCYSFQVSSLRPGAASEWVRHICGGITATELPVDDESHNLASWRQDCPTPIAIDTFKSHVNQCRIEYSAEYQCIRRLWRGADQVLGEIAIPMASYATTAHQASAELLEACVQVAMAVLPALLNQEPMIVERVTSLRVYDAVASPLWVRASLSKTQNPLAVDIIVADAEGTPLLVIEDLRFRRLVERELPVAVNEVDFRQQWRDADDGQRRRLVESQTRLQLARVLGSGAAQHISSDERLIDLGIDSMMAVELKLRLETSLREPLPDNLVFEFPTLRALNEFLYDRLQSAER